MHLLPIQGPESPTWTMVKKALGRSTKKVLLPLPLGPGETCSGKALTVVRTRIIVSMCQRLEGAYLEKQQADRHKKDTVKMPFPYRRSQMAGGHSTSLASVPSSNLQLWGYY